MEWISLDQAEQEGLSLRGYRGAIGPRRTGAVYLDRYWGTVSTVTSVMVRVERLRNPRTGRFTRAVTGWNITEYSSEDVRDRTHMTSWQYNVRDHVILHGPGDIRPRSER